MSPDPQAAAGLFSPIFTSDEMAAATSDAAVLTAMLEVEARLAATEAELGLVPALAAGAIATACSTGHFDLDALGRAARLSANPVIPLVAALRSEVGAEAAPYVHFGATSQDILDTAFMLVTQRAADLVMADLGRLAAAAAALADRYRATLQLARTLLQPALPTTFGLRAALWLTATLDATDSIRRVRDQRLALQLGGAAGTLASLGSDGLRVAERLAGKLGLATADLPWHTDRQRVVEAASAFAVAAGVAAKIGHDVCLLMQAELAEVAEPFSEGWGGSSTLPQKRNPSLSPAILASSRRAAGLAGILLAAMDHELDRSPGAWHAEWQTLLELLRAAGGAVANAAVVVEGLEVDTVRMAANLEATGGLVMAEHVVVRLTPLLGAAEARSVVEQASRRAGERGVGLGEELNGLLHPDRAELDEWLRPESYLGVTDELINRAIARYESENAR